jgi:predicted glutamine amidotransferase
MCRLLGVVSTEPAALTQTLEGDLQAFAELSALHCDGWGHAYWHGAGLTVTKAPEAAQDSDGFWRSVGYADTDAALLHLRMASPGMRKDAHNTHPFEARGMAFAHNGYFTPLERINPLLHEVGAHQPKGSTDSERFFALVLAAMDDSDPVEALWTAARQICERADVVYALNALLLTPEALYALECWSEDAPPRPEAGEASYKLYFRTTDGHVTVASDGWEPLTSDWEQVGNGNILEVRRGDASARVHEVAEALLA